MQYINLDKNICCEDVIQGLFDLNELDIKVYKKLRETGEIRADELAKKLSRERSTIYRSLQRLTFCELCKKETRTIKEGGYYHTYHCEDLKNTKERLEDCIEKWHKKMKLTIQNLD